MTWKSIAEKANRLNPKSLKPPLEQKAIDTGPFEYISAAVNGGSIVWNISPQKAKPDESSNDKSGIQSRLGSLLHSRIENAFTSLVLKKKKSLGVKTKAKSIFEEFELSKGQIDISEKILDKEEL